MKHMLNTNLYSGALLLTGDTKLNKDKVIRFHGLDTVEFYVTP